MNSKLFNILVNARKTNQSEVKNFAGEWEWANEIAQQEFSLFIQALTHLHNVPQSKQTSIAQQGQYVAHPAKLQKEYCKQATIFKNSRQTGKKAQKQDKEILMIKILTN